MSSGRLAESHTTKLSFAVVLRDEYSQGDPIGRIDVSLKEVAKKVVMNAGRYYIFLDLPVGRYTAQVRSDYFFEESAQIDTASHSPDEPVLIELRPRPCYPFPHGETLIRGVIRNDSGDPVPGAKISLSVGERRLATESTEKGEFAVYFGPLDEEEILKDDVTGRYYVRGTIGRRVVLQVIFGSLTSNLEIDGVEVGKTNTIKR